MLSLVKAPFILFWWMVILVSPFTKRWTLRVHLTNGRQINYVLAFPWLNKSGLEKVEEIFDLFYDMDFKATMTAIRFNLEVPEGRRKIVVNPANVAAVEVIKG